MRNLYNLIGDVSIEWVIDNEYNVWIVQLNQLKNTSSKESVVVDGKVEKYIKFESKNGLEELRKLIASMPKKYGIEIIGNVGITSHFGDLLRQNNIPSRIVKGGIINGKN